MNKIVQIVISVWLVTGLFWTGNGFFWYDVKLYTDSCQRVDHFQARHLYIKNDNMIYYSDRDSSIWQLHDIKEIHLKQKDEQPTILRKIEGQFQKVKYPSCNLQI